VHEKLRIIFKFTEHGTGQNKKEAKHAAAKAMLDKLMGNTTNAKASAPGHTEK
jgi:dsRNA-specific ribonuclease